MNDIVQANGLSPKKGGVHVTNLGKAYKQYSSRWSRLVEWLFPFLGSRCRLKWVLTDINFQIDPGEAVGIIGINGAGKSTLLKLITGTSQPTTGRIESKGYVTALLELGMGFHPDFTGRQNAYMAGQLIGLSSKEIDALMPGIEAFAEIGDYIDQPLRMYSSGMQMRLAFSLASARRPDILIVDEAMSVGDAYFQHKCFERIREFRRQGTTLLLVSHDKAAIQSICDRAILLDSGVIMKEGTPEVVMDFYNAMLAEKEHMAIRQVIQADGRTSTISGSGEARLIDIALLNGNGDKVESLVVGDEATLKLTVEIFACVPRLVLGFLIKDRLGQEVFGTNTHHTGLPVLDLERGDKVTYSITFPTNLGPGSYSITTSLHSTDTHLENNYDWRDLAFLFSVINGKNDVFIGTAWLNPTIAFQRNLGCKR